MHTAVQQTRGLAKSMLRPILEHFGCGYLSSVGLDGIDRELVELLGHKRNGVFIEAGANDGISQSNTYYLEKVLNWSGILVEPLPDLAAKCFAQRDRAVVYNAALVREGYGQETVPIERANLMSVINDGVLSTEEVHHHLERARYYEQIEETETLQVSARTLTSILTDAQIRDIDFFSLDVEGYEYEVLKGLDLNLFRIDRIFVETRPSNEADITRHLSALGYREERTWQQAAYKNILFRRSTSA